MSMYQKSLRAAAIMLVLGAMLMAVTQVDATVQQSGPVQGEVLMITQGIPGTMVIRDQQGRGIILHLTPQTQMGGQFKPGDKVEATITPYGVTSVQPQQKSAGMQP